MDDGQRLLAGRYELGELIGRGGMADVHLGFDTRLGREVAIKILRSELARDRSFLMRFRREAQSAASLNHPAIVAVFDSGEESVKEAGGAEVSVPFIVMEYVRGHSLRDILTTDGALEPFEAARVMAEVLRALDYSHEHGIIHRDIKPANVMMTHNGEPKVMDFGIARAIADTAATMTHTSVVVGTAQYLSPEQAQGQEVDARSDLYSAGALLYELITGRPPFVGDSPVAIAYQHVGEPAQPPSVHAPGIPASLDVVVLHALDKDPDRRYQTGAAFADDLDAVINGGPTLAGREALAAGYVGPHEPAETTRTSRPVSSSSAFVADEVIEEDRPDRSRWWLLALGLLALLGILLGVLYNQGLFKGEPDPVAVPTVVQKSQEEATRLVQQAGFQVAAQPVRNRSRAGTVVDQKPQAQSMQPPGTTIVLSVSSGPGMVTIPDLRNYEQSLASQRLSDLNLKIGDITPVDSYTVDQGKVVSTDPKAGRRVPEGTTVKLSVSSGRVPVPGVVGMSEQNAVEALTKVGLRANAVQVESDKDPGTVIDQAYPEGTKIPVGDVIQISVAKPPPSPSTITRTETVTQTPTTATPSDTPTDGNASSSPTETPTSPGTPTERASATPTG